MSEQSPNLHPSAIRVYIVDDSAVMRSLLRAVVQTDSELEVAGTASDGLTALNALATVKPDLILLDVEMPVMDGLETLRQIRERAPKLPVIMCSSLTQRGARVTIDALAAGASDYVAKPAGAADRASAMKALELELLPKIRALTAKRISSAAISHIPGARPLRLISPAQKPPLIFPSSPQPWVAPRANARIAPAVVAIGVSTGGPAALDVLLPALPESFRIPILVVQHMPEIFTRQLAERLDSRCTLRVREAGEGMSVLAGNIYIARGNWHMHVLASAAKGAPPTLHLTQNPPENHCRPSVDVLFRSVANVYGPAVLAVMLTGMGYDGLAGSRILYSHGAQVIAQDEATSAVWGMPGSVANAGLAQSVLPLDGIAPEIMRLTGKSAARPASMNASHGRAV